MASLGNDLFSIRKKLDLSIEDIKQKTKIPTHILKAIEDDTIFSEMEANSTYIRSYVRSYAKVLKIKHKRIVKALDQIEKGTYKGMLADESDISNEESQSSSSLSEKETIPESDKSARPSKEPSAPAEKSERSDRKSVSPPVTKTPSINSVDWADMGKKFNPIPTGSRLWTGAVLLMLAAAIVLFVIGYQYYFAEDDPSEDLSQTETTRQAVNSDSLQLNLADPTGNDTEPQTGITPLPAESLPDTLVLTIYAAYEKLEPVRVYTDIMDSLNPYWIEQGHAYQFEFVNRVELRGQYSRMVLLLNGHILENIGEEFLNTETGMIEIRRSYFENDDRWLQEPPDLPVDGIPAPDSIGPRPTFN